MGLFVKGKTFRTQFQILRSVSGIVTLLVLETFVVAVLKNLFHAKSDILKN